MKHFDFGFLAQIVGIVVAFFVSCTAALLVPMVLLHSLIGGQAGMAAGSFIGFVCMVAAVCSWLVALDLS